MNNTRERLQKLIAASGLASRRAAEELITTGRVRVNGKAVLVLGSQADPTTDVITVDNRPLPKPATITYVVNKPRGIICSREQQGKDPIITSLVPDFPAVFPIGRLDKESEGLILLTNDGDLAYKLTHPSFSHSKTYQVITKWEKEDEKNDPSKICQHLVKGVKLGDGKAAADSATFKALANGTFQLTLTVHEGRTHLIRRMCASVGLKVVLLRRTALGHLQLGGIKPGSYRLLTPFDLTRL